MNHRGRMLLLIIKRPFGVDIIENKLLPMHTRPESDVKPNGFAIKHVGSYFLRGKLFPDKLRVNSIASNVVQIIPILVLVMTGSCASTRKAAESVPQHNNYQLVTIDNINPRCDVVGDVIDAHDGCLQFFEGRYYLYGTAYGKTAGFSINNRFRVYSSPDLKHWQFDGELVQAPPDGVYYRPYVVFNPNTRKYVLWYNWYPKLWDGQVGVATSDTPVGPFTIQNPNVRVSRADSKPGDGSLFVDDDGTGYFIYTVIGEGHAIRVEKLTKDYFGSTGVASEILAKDCEAPVLFRRNDVYYALFDQCCCFCVQGSGTRVYKSRSPLGPFTESSNINRYAGNGEPIVAAQQTWVAKIMTSDGPAFSWMGDRWGSRLDGIKGHDFQFWSAPLEFDRDANIMPLTKVPTWQAYVQTGDKQRLRKGAYSWPKKKDPHPISVDPCSGKRIPPEQIDGLP